MFDIIRLRSLRDEYNSLIAMEDQLEWVKNHQKDVKLMLDNDMTFPVFVNASNEIITEEDYDLSESIELNDLKWYLGYNNGVKILLECYGIKNWDEV